MERHKKYPHLILCEVRQDSMGSLIVQTGELSTYLQFEEEKELFWDSCLGKTSKSVKATRYMVESGYRQEVWAYDEYLEAINCEY